MVPSKTMIQRDRLTKSAGSMSDYHLLYVQAPAGYGKTVFAGQWLESRQKPGAMITLDEYDNSAECLCRKLRSLLEDLYPDKEQVTAFTMHPEFDKAPVEFLMRAAAALPKECAAGFAIDDLHYLTDSRAQKVLQDFLTRLPDGTRTCLLSRNQLPDAFSGQVLKQDLTFIPQDLLCFDSSEIAVLYQSKGIPITEKTASQILAYTEGWPLGISALLLSEKQIPTKNISLDWLDSFLKTQVWNTWEESSREFMVATCIEDVLSESLCDALTGEHGSGLILERMLTEGVFLSRHQGGTYQFHRLFREFLRKQFDDRPEKYRIGQFQRAGQWHLAHDHFYQAVRRFACSKDYEKVAGCFDMLEVMDRAVFDMEQIMKAVHDTLNEEITKQYPFLYYMLAYTARSEGRPKAFQEYADLYYANYPRIVERDPELAHNIFFLYAMDSRFTLFDIIRMAGDGEASSTFRGVRGSATLYFPLYHRSYRDFTELLPGDIDAGVELLGKTLGMLLGEESGMLLDCIQGGLYYEQGDLQRARELALSASAKLQSRFAPESKFCAMALLLMTSHALHQTKQTKLIEQDIQDMIETDKAYYLQRNFDAVLCRNRLDFGDIGAAQNWLTRVAGNVYEVLGFFDLYEHFTTARAYITLGNFNQAIILMEKIFEMSKILKRPIDMIEAELLISIAYWKTKRGRRKTALMHFENAILLAQPTGYMQAFINEGDAAAAMLSHLKNRTIRSDYSGELSESFVKQVYVRATEQNHLGRGLAGGVTVQTVKLTAQQKRVAKLMCGGYSYRKIAEEMGIQFSTVRSHIELIYGKLEVSSMEDAIMKIRRLRILDEP